jgi:hypothetical protein
VAGKISPGRIVWAKLTPPRGNNLHRPAIALSEPDADGYFFVIGGSTKPLAPPEFQFELPAGPHPKQHPLTKLKKPTFVDINWFDRIHTDALHTRNGGIGGTCPGPMWMDIQRKVKILHNDKMNPPAAGSV